MGTGTDIVQIPRIEKLINLYGNRFIHRVFTSQEQSYAFNMNPQQRAAFYGKRFAAKEAIVKALGTGFRDGIILQHIEILKDDQGKPTVNLKESALTFINSHHKSYDTGHITHRIELTLSDDYPIALAFAIWIQRTS